MTPRLGWSIKRSVWAMQILFWPGVMLHELAHLVVGRLLWVKTYGLNLTPKVEKDGTVTMGSVQVPQTDVFRFMLIGVAPVYVGLTVIFSSLWLAEYFNVWQWWAWWLVIGWLMFEVGNTMFTSRSDLAWALRLSIILAVVIGIAVWAGWRPDFAWVEPWLDSYNDILSLAQRWLWLPIVVDVIIIPIVWLLDRHLIPVRMAK